MVLQTVVYFRNVCDILQNVASFAPEILSDKKQVLLKILGLFLVFKVYLPTLTFCSNTKCIPKSYPLTDSNIYIIVNKNILPIDILFLQIFLILTT